MANDESEEEKNKKEAIKKEKDESEQGNIYLAL